MKFSGECDKIISPSLEGLQPLEQRLAQSAATKSKEVILLAGPTNCGKTAISLLLAKLLGGEIISADSMQVYRGMDIGTAKVSQEDRGQIPHHLIDIRHVQESFNVVDFYYEAKQACESILARDRVPIIVGGTGFYFSSLLYGPPSGPPSIPEVRANLEKQMDKFGPEALYEKLKEEDPVYAATITCNDRQKILRALEIITLTGAKVSEHHWKRQNPRSEYAFHSWFVYRPREVLYPLIEERCDQMIEMGLLDEVEELKREGIVLNRSAAQAIGYRQSLEYLESGRTDQDYQHFERTFKTASRHLAKRQFTWFRKEPLFRWVNVDVHDYEMIAEMIAQEYLSTTK